MRESKHSEMIEVKSKQLYYGRKVDGKCVETVF